uniref:Uncharacterized protein n=1 Tax=Pristionchus pacificus TaxID=54126 RepID=A0A2A6D2D9_PRIPA|eukprot:PDM84453.1 hypothetical protein PRIPAC_33476 [Pristionchus pacificus]
MPGKTTLRCMAAKSWTMSSSSSWAGTRFNGTTYHGTRVEMLVDIRVFSPQSRDHGPTRRRPLQPPKEESLKRLDIDSYH